MTSSLKHWSRSLAIFLVLAAPVAAQTQFEMNEEACGQRAAADKELNKTYKAVLWYYRADKPFSEKVRQAQRSWITYRDAQIEARYPLEKDEDPHLVFGSMYPMLICGFEEELTRDRTAFLKKWMADLDDEMSLLRTGGERYYIKDYQK